MVTVYLNIQKINTSTIKHLVLLAPFFVCDQIGGKFGSLISILGFASSDPRGSFRRGIWQVALGGDGPLVLWSEAPKI